MKQPHKPKKRLGISSCLLGNNVRYDGGHKLDRFLADTLSQYIEWVPVCPEVECGLPVPREAMHLTGSPTSPRLVTINTGVDHTDSMLSWVDNRTRELEPENIHGFILKSGSPSCGVEGVEIYDSTGCAKCKGVGLFARMLLTRFPQLPIVDEVRLRNRASCEKFLRQVLDSAQFEAAGNDLIRCRFPTDCQPGR